MQRQTLNAKVNNLAVEFEQFNLKLEWIQDIKNTLTDSLSRLLEVDPEAKLHLKERDMNLEHIALKSGMQYLARFLGPADGQH